MNTANFFSQYFFINLIFFVKENINHINSIFFSFFKKWSIFDLSKVLSSKKNWHKA